jgi:hypothetical protein
MPHTLEDLVAASVGQRPMDFERSFNAIMMDRAAAAVEAQKAQMAKGMFNVPVEDVEVEEDVEEVEERFGGKGSDPSLRNNPPQGQPGGAAPTPPSKGTGKSDLMTSLKSIRANKTPITKIGS